MKKLFTYLMVMATLLIGGGKAMAQSVTIDGVVYTLSGDHAYVSGNSGVGDTVVVLGKVTINEVEYPVTEIGYRAFYRTTQVLAYTLPDGITSIGTEAFYDNYALKTINLPSSIETIGHMAFGYNWDVQITELPANLKTLDTEAFRGCQSATFTKIPAGVTHIPNGTFRGCHSLTSLELPKGLTRIDDYAFEGCTALATVNIPAEAVITHIGTGVFNNTQVTFPEENGIRYMGSVAYELTDRSLTEYVIKEGTTVIFPNLFADCTNMTSITIPNSVVSIGDNAFYGCTSLPIEGGIRYADCYAIEVINKTLTEYTLKDNVRFLGNALFQDCSAMTSISLPDSLTSIGSYAFYCCSSLTSVDIPSRVTEIGNHTFAGSALTSITLPESLTSIGSHAFYMCSSLTSVDIPDGVTVVNDYTFDGCSALTSIALPDSLTFIGRNAFNSCSSLPSVDIPSRVTVINDYTFQYCNALVSMTLPEGVTSIGNGAFRNCSALITVTLSPSLTSIASDAFYQCNNLQKIINYSNLPLTRGSSNYGYVAHYAQQIINVDTIIDGFWFDTDANGKHHLTYYEGTDSILTLPSDFQDGNYGIDANVFSGHNEIVSIQFPDGITSIGASAFSGCSALTSLTLPESVASIGSEAFYNCSSLTSVNIPSDVTAISANTFNGCAALTSMTIPASVISIGNHAFQGCTDLKELTLADGGKTLSLGYNEEHSGQFTPCKLEKLYLGRNLNNTNFNGGQYSPFYNITTLKDVVVGDSVTSLAAYTFYNCTSLSSITLSENLASIAHEVFYNCSSLTSLHLPDSLKSIGNSAFCGCSSLTSVNIPSGVPTIGEYTFYNCSSLTSLHLPDSLKSIGNRAFYGCSSLASVNVPEGVSVIEEYTFYNCASLDSLTIPASVTSIGNNSFYGCTGLKELTFADGNETLSLGSNSSSTSNNNYGLFNSSSLDKLYLGRNLSYSTNHLYTPFYNQTALKEVVVGDSVTAIGANAFYNCSSLPSIHLHEGITSVGANAFYGCSALTSITIPSSVTSIGGYAFYECGILTYVYSDIESPAVLASSSLRNQAVIYVPEGTYVPYKELFPNNIIVDGAEKEVTVHVAIPGTLGEEVLNQIPYIRNVNSLKVSGTLNSDDIATINGSMVNLLHLDLSKTSMTSVSGIGHVNLCSIVFPDSCKSISGYSERNNLTSITLPDAVKMVDNSCFYECDQLRTVSFGDGDKYIGRSAFGYCDRLSFVSLGTGVATLGERAFDHCTNLQKLVIGGSINATAPYVFDWCHSSEIHIPNIEAWLNSVFHSDYIQHEYHDYLASIPNYASANVNLYIDGELLTDVVIPSSVTSIRHYAFYNIKGITSVTIPEGVTSIGGSAFSGCSGLTSVTIPEGVTSIGGGAFQNCSRLTSVSILEGVKAINRNTFYNCDRLASINVPEGVHTVSDGAFAQCDSLKSITLPSTLSNCAAGAFSGSGLTEVTCPAFFPPVTGGDVIGANNCTLYVPEWTLNRYKLANNWNLFAAIEPISGIYPSTISVYTEEGLTIPAEGLAEGYTPNLEIVRYDASNVGRLTLRGEKAMPLSTFRMEQTRDAGTMTSLVNYGTLTADSVATELTISASNWHYLTFPYDVKIADIATLGDWVIRRYDGASRARADFSSTWQNVPYDSILHAGEGYIWYSTNGNFTVPAIENDNRNLIFANDARYTQLKEHASATEANYGWNLIGNPYPCFYDTRFMEFSSPITVRSGNSYAAYSPVDDSYILSPLEAFFVQCSADNNVVGFTTEGRQTDNTVRTLTSAPSPTRSAAASRSVLNLYLENGSYADHTRLVVNESASMDYEIACDAAKFMSEDNSLPQLFTFVNNERMAINERPLADGEAVLGVYIGKTGSYTLSLDTRATDTEVYLIDKYSGTETDLNSFSYDFTAEAGTYNDRFEIVMKRIGETAITEEATAAVKVMGTTGAINILNATAPIYVYNAAGALVATQNGGDVTVEVAPGVYVVKVGDEIHKVSVIK